MDLTAGLDGFGENSCTCRDSNPDRLARSLVAIPSTAWVSKPRPASLYYAARGLSCKLCIYTTEITQRLVTSPRAARNNRCDLCHKKFGDL